MEVKAGRARKDSPLKGGEHAGGPRRPARVAAAADQAAEEDGEGDEAGEPEEHGQGLDGQDGELVGRAREQPRREGQVGERGERPERGEDQEVVLRRRVQARTGVIVIPMRDCRQRRRCQSGATLRLSSTCGSRLTIACQTKRDDGEQGLDGP